MKQSTKTKLRRAAMYLLGFSATPFFSACYGVPTNYEDIYDFDPFDDVTGTVLDRKTDKPIPGIKVTAYDISDQDVSAITDAEGKFHISHHYTHNILLYAEDIDGNTNGNYCRQEEEVTDINNQNLTIYMRPEDK